MGHRSTPRGPSGVNPLEISGVSGLLSIFPLELIVSLFIILL